MVIYAGKLDEHKGGLLLAEAIRDKLEANGREIEFLIIGNIVGDHGRSVESVLAASSNHIIRLPTQRYFDLAKYYQAADLAVYPKQCSLSFFEAQACGVPVLFEENEINVQRSKKGNAFTFVPKSIDDFRAKIKGLACLSEEENLEISKNARTFVVETYDFLPISQDYTDVLQRAVRNWALKNQSKISTQ